MIKTDSLYLHQVDIGYTIRHGSVRAVGSRLSATAPAGSLTCLIGRNGTGKSTLLRTIARLQQPLDGNIYIGTDDIWSMPRGELARRLSIVLTKRPDADNLTVGELAALGRAPYTGFWGRLSDADRQATDRALRLVGMSDMARRRICSLSDGECQKAMIAKSLAQDTPVILLDEPSAFLDYPGKVELMRILSRLAHDEGKTILLSTHDLDTALPLADRLWLMHDGQLDEGTPQELADNGLLERCLEMTRQKANMTK